MISEAVVAIQAHSANRKARAALWMFSLLCVPIATLALSATRVLVWWHTYLGISKNSDLPAYELLPLLPLPMIGALVAVHLHRRQSNRIAFIVSVVVNAFFLGLLAWALITPADRC